MTLQTGRIIYGGTDCSELPHDDRVCDRDEDRSYLVFGETDQARLVEARMDPSEDSTSWIADLEFFGFIRRTTVLHLYDDHEVWEALGYEGESFSKGGYLHRGFDDLDWLPDPPIELDDAAGSHHTGGAR